MLSYKPVSICLDGIAVRAHPAPASAGPFLFSGHCHPKEKLAEKVPALSAKTKGAAAHRGAAAPFNS